MSVQTYIQDPRNGFSVTEQTTLAKWYSDFGNDNAWKLIGRNFDRDCDRQDIDTVLLREFLQNIALAYLPLLPEAPLAVMDSILGGRRSHFLLPGLPLTDDKARIARVVRADHLLKYQLHLAAFPITMELGPLIAALQAGRIDGKDLTGSQMGRSDYPVWVCPADQLPANADNCRDKLGLHHIVHGHLVSISYPCTVLDSTRTALRAPTALDGAANGAGNWIFAKRGTSGGPEWGHAVDLGKCAPGVDEAVHGNFTIDSAKANQVTLGYIGPISASPPQVNFANLLAQI